MNTKETLSAIKAQRFVPIFRARNIEEAREVTAAVVKSGVFVMEYTMTTPGILSALPELKAEFPRLCIGVGSVFNAADAKTAILNGAEFIVSPVCAVDLAHVVKSEDKLLMLAGFTPTEIWNAHNAGSDLVKIFPAGLHGPRFIKDLHGPMPDMDFFVTGGLSSEKAPDYIDAGAVAVGLGGELFKKEWIANGEWDKITKKCEQVLQLLSDKTALAKIC